MATHIIHKQKVTLQVPAQQDAFGYQDKVSKLLNNGLLTAIERVLDEMASPGEVIRIDTLALDLGVIDAKQFDAVFKAKLVTSLQQAVLKSKAGNAGNAGSTAAETKPAAANQRDAFMYFMLHGSLPWYAGFANMQAWEDALFAQWQPTDWRLVAEWVKARQQQGVNSTQRIAWQFSNAFIAQIALYFFKISGNAEGLTVAAIQDWHADIVTINTTITGNSIAGVAKKAWLDIVETMLKVNKATRPDDIASALILKQFTHGSHAEVRNTVAKKAMLLSAVKTGVISTVLGNVISAFESGRSLNAIVDKVLNGEDRTVSGSDIKEGEINSRHVENIGGTMLNGEDTEQQEQTKPAANNKLVKTVASTPEDVLYLNSCGLVLLHPFLGAYFSDIGLIEKKQFIDAGAQQRAILLLHYLATGDTEVSEFNLGLQKLLCGYAQEQTLPSEIVLTGKEKFESEQLLRSVIDYWPPLKNTSIAGFQQTFLQRAGRLSAIQSGWLLRVEQKAVDVLLGKLPWGYSTIRLPWMDGMLNVEWA